MAEIEMMPYCQNDSHTWRESYYGYQCSKCPMFYPYGSAPWEDTGDDDDSDSDDGEFDMDDCYRMEDGFCGKASSEECEFECPFRE